MNFNTVTVIGKLLTKATPFVDQQNCSGLQFELEVIDRYYRSSEDRKRHLTHINVLIYKKTIQDFILSLKIEDVILLSCKLGNVHYENFDKDSKIGLILSPYLGEAVLLEKSKIPMTNRDRDDDHYVF